jgi:hypothetical protein
MRGSGAAFALALAAFAIAPARAQDKIAARIEALEQRVGRLEALAARDENEASELVIVRRWSETPTQNDLSKSYRITYTLKSHCAKPIKLIDGTLDFIGPDGQRLYTIPLTREAQLAAAGEATFTGSYFLNPMQPQDVKLGELPPSRITTRLHLRRIVFRDNTVLPLE